MFNGNPRQIWKQARRPQKFGAVPVETPEGRFASQREHQRYCVLKLMQRAKQITNLERQVPFSFDLNGVHIGKYVADFVYFENGARVVEDCKGVATDLFRWKSRMMRAFFNIEVRLT